ncbi:MAG: hypothetical protein CMF60_04905 [Magnetococcales bacterium]|nr:hypothetical protein [Magnetococcales bacterium]|tara:strand:+ start:7863 stop:8246 length:384 start_codon:yes stop_codon:yes gene_type:complete
MRGNAHSSYPTSQLSNAQTKPQDPLTETLTSLMLQVLVSPQPVQLMRYMQLNTAPQQKLTEQNLSDIEQMVTNHFKVSIRKSKTPLEDFARQYAMALVQGGIITNLNYQADSLLQSLHKDAQKHKPH